MTLSLGGATGSVGFQSDSQATSFAQTIWSLFLGGSSSTRPFGSAILDGYACGLSFTKHSCQLPLRVDLDIEGGGSTYYAAFVNEIRSLASGASKTYVKTSNVLGASFDDPLSYYVTAAPQCVFPDGNLGTVLNTAIFDAIYGIFSLISCEESFLIDLQSSKATRNLHRTLLSLSQILQQPLWLASVQSSFGKQGDKGLLPSLLISKL